MLVIIRPRGREENITVIESTEAKLLSGIFTFFKLQSYKGGGLRY